MMDLVVRTPRAPENGETIIGDIFSRFPGGKGANQAVSAARLSRNVTMIGKVGTDEYGDEAIEVLTKEGINTNYILRDSDYPTGVGSVTVEKNGDNRIIVVPGANLNLTVEDLNKFKEIIRNAKLLVVQLEMNLSMTKQAITFAFEDKVPVILNPAPAQALSDKLLRKVTYLTPNETEAEILSGVKVETIEDAEKAGKVILSKGVKNVIMTLGKEGALIVNNSGTHHVSGFKVNPYDTVAAGDAFNGALAVGIRDGKPLIEAVKYANAAGAITVTRAGAISSLPNAKEVESLLRKFNT